MRRQPGESMRKWTSRFEAFIKKTGNALHQADAEIDETTFLHPLIQRILLLECSILSPSENAAVLATSGATTKEGGSIGNSYLYVDLAASFIAQWDDEHSCVETRLHRDVTYHTAAAATTTWDLSSPSSAFLEQDTVDSGEWETAGGPELGRAGGGQCSGRQLDRGASHQRTQRTQSWKINLAPWKQRRPTQ